jgi:putative transposase
MADDRFDERGGWPHHVIRQAASTARLFIAPGDWYAYYRVLAESAQRHAVAVHAYAMMPDHVHLLVTPARAGELGRMLRAVARRYVQYFNQRYGRSGTVWRGPSRAEVLASETEVLACYRRIETYPVRAGIVQMAADYRWSSLRHNLGMHVDAVVTPHAAWLALGADPQARFDAYLRQFAPRPGAGSRVAIAAPTAGLRTYGRAVPNPSAAVSHTDLVAAPARALIPPHLRLSSGPHCQPGDADP